MVFAITYIRVSTEEQDPENQRVYLEKWASERGIQILKHYFDVGVSGATEPWERPAFKQLADEVSNMNPKPSVLLVYEISRLVRSFQELFTLLDFVENKLGLVVVSASEREQVLQSLDGVYRQFLRAVLAFVATMEREFIRQRTKVAMERARVVGKIKNVVEKLSEEDKERIVEMWKNGMTIGEIARALGLSTYAVRRVLSSEKLYRPSEDTCPRCFAKMKVIDRFLNGRRLVIRLYCPNCGYEEVREL